MKLEHWMILQPSIRLSRLPYFFRQCHLSTIFHPRCLGGSLELRKLSKAKTNGSSLAPWIHGVTMGIIADEGGKPVMAAWLGVSENDGFHRRKLAVSTWNNMDNDDWPIDQKGAAFPDKAISHVQTSDGEFRQGVLQKSSRSGPPLEWSRWHSHHVHRSGTHRSGNRPDVNNGSDVYQTNSPIKELHELSCIAWPSPKIPKLCKQSHRYPAQNIWLPRCEFHAMQLWDWNPTCFVCGHPGPISPRARDS